MSIEITIDSLVPLRLSPYAEFKMIKIKRSSKTISQSIERFLDFCKFTGIDVEQKAIKFCDCFPLLRRKIK
jgi:hypothetical protein